jgi:phage shock protein A
LPDELQLWTTLDEKRAQLLVYRNALQEITAHQQDIVALNDKAEGLPERGSKVDQLLSQLTQQHATLLKRAQVGKHNKILNWIITFGLCILF